MNSPIIYPLNVSTLEKGQVIERATLEEIFGIQSTDRRWGFRLLRLRAFIEKRRRDLGLPVVTLRSKDGKLIVCDDNDAASYNRGMGKRGLKRFRKATYRNLHVDSTRLTHEERQAHENTIKRQAILMRAITGATRVKKLEQPNGRTTPRMIAGNGIDDTDATGVEPNRRDQK